MHLSRTSADDTCYEDFDTRGDSADTPGEAVNWSSSDELDVVSRHRVSPESLILAVFIILLFCHRAPLTSQTGQYLGLDLQLSLLAHKTTRLLNWRPHRGQRNAAAKSQDRLRFQLQLVEPPAPPN
ncbi:hypothetical protein NM208_g3848 [Fusarium decemcellulare]|uniref:Uncharacterized protein n=1 Tax=Fusarium decemcellulare TaxID=57161 RepID=A0ACC1SMS5_9HYPO|nr:hypothetical protein NM208_g3848 [Fusarium decemcellulare]